MANKEIEHVMNTENNNIITNKVTSSKACVRKSALNMGCFSRLPCVIQLLSPTSYEESPVWRLDHVIFYQVD